MNIKVMESFNNDVTAKGWVGVACWRYAYCLVHCFEQQFALHRGGGGGVKNLKFSVT